MQSKLARVATAAAIAGTAEELSGGKFSNGAVTGAFVVMFNDLMHEGDPTTKQKDPYPGTKEMENAYAESFEKNVLNRFSKNPSYLPYSAEEIGEDLLNSEHLISSKYEYELRPIAVNVKGYNESGKMIDHYMGKTTSKYGVNSLPKVKNPGINLPRETEINSFNIDYRYVIVYQIKTHL